MVVIWLIVVITGGLHALALLVVRPLRRLPSQQDTTVLPEPSQQPSWPHSGHG
jgi:hypothetical protein